MWLWRLLYLIPTFWDKNNQNLATDIQCTVNDFKDTQALKSKAVKLKSDVLGITSTALLESLTVIWHFSYVECVTLPRLWSDMPHIIELNFIHSVFGRQQKQNSKTIKQSNTLKQDPTKQKHRSWKNTQGKSRNLTAPASTSLWISSCRCRWYSSYSCCE